MLQVGRDRDVDHLGTTLLEHPGDILVRGQPVSLGNRCGVGESTGGNRQWVESCLPVGDQVTVGHDEPGADTGNWDLPPCGKLRQVVKLGGR